MADIIVSAQRRIQREPIPPDKRKLFWWGPIKKVTDLSTLIEWQSKCHQYKVVRSISKYGGDNRFVAMVWSLSKKKFSSRLITHHGDTKSKYPFTDVDFKSLSAAFEACEKHYMRRKKQEELDTNTYKILKRAEEEGLAALPTPSQAITAKPTKERKEAGEDNGSGVKGRIFLFDQPITAVLRWMGKDRWKREDVDKVMKHYNIPVANGTIIAQLAAGKNGTRGDPAKLTDKQVEELYSVIG